VTLEISSQSLAQPKDKWILQRLIEITRGKEEREGTREQIEERIP